MAATAAETAEVALQCWLRGVLEKSLTALHPLSLLRGRRSVLALALLSAVPAFAAALAVALERMRGLLPSMLQQGKFRD